ncbi:hypothetical protein NIES4071_98150 [Calothrix sp. NIES-4071]|nr:hypothetical protein NIES4071_98150 [Calothrix sp. NIES-4071]BAZ64079.1 hypothetical protein NIES4105_98080 [Calothrix sp. NIES-4105]
MEILGDNYKVYYETSSASIYFHGSLRLNGMEEYAPILKLLNDVVNSNPPRITLNLMHLDFLNSSGITMLSKFVIAMRSNKSVHMMILGANAIPWQSKLLKNLQKLMPNLNLKMV